MKRGNNFGFGLFAGSLSLIFILLQFTAPVYSQWINSVGGTDEDSGLSIAVDNNGNVYTIGYFYDVVDFDPGSGETFLTSNGNGDVFVAKYDEAGSLLWAISFGGGGSDYGQDIAVDNDGNIYVTGWFYGTVDFDPSANAAELTSAGGADIFCAKYNAGGNYLWAFNVGDPDNEYGLAIGVDFDSNVFITGTFETNVDDGIDFDPAPGNDTHTLGASQDNLFFVKYNSSGEFQWVEKCDGQAYDCVTPKDMDVDAEGNLYLSGLFYGDIDFDPSDDANILSDAGSYDLFFAMYSGSGDMFWAYSIGSENQDAAYGIAVDQNYDVYITGTFSGEADFDPDDASETLLTPIGSWDIFFAKYNESGEFQWAKNIGNDRPLCNSICVDNYSNIYISGYFYGPEWSPFDFDPGPEEHNLTAVGNYDVFLASYNSDGDYRWASGFGGTEIEEGKKVAVDNSDYVFVIGEFRSTVDFDPGDGTDNHTSAGSSDIFFGKYFSSSGMLPVELTSFKANIQGNSVSLKWETASETNNRGFEIQRSAASGSDAEWERAGFVEGAGNSINVNSYSFTDRNLSTGNYKYRLKQMDFDGSFEYSNVIEIEILPSKFFLQQNYPNPFSKNSAGNSLTKIKFSLGKKEFTQIKIYNMLGEEVASLANKELTAGNYEVLFNANRLPSGVYIYRITAGDFTASKKMNLIK